MNVPSLRSPERKEDESKKKKKNIKCSNTLDRFLVAHFSVMNEIWAISSHYAPFKWINNVNTPREDENVQQPTKKRETGRFASMVKSSNIVIFFLLLSHSVVIFCFHFTQEFRISWNWTGIFRVRLCEKMFGKKKKNYAVDLINNLEKCRMSAVRLFVNYLTSSEIFTLHRCARPWLPSKLMNFGVKKTNFDVS